MRFKPRASMSGREAMDRMRENVALLERQGVTRAEFMAKVEESSRYGQWLVRRP